MWGALFPYDLVRMYMTSWNVFALELVIISKHVFLNNLSLGNAGFRRLVSNDLFVTEVVGVPHGRA